MQCKNFVLPWKYMNSTINKTFYTCSTESMLLRCDKIPEKAVKLGSFLQFSLHIFIRHDGYIWKINLRILWNYVMNSQVKHGQCDSIIFHRNIFFWRLKVIARPLPCWQQESLLLISPGIYLQIYNRTQYPAVLICKEIK